MVRGIRPLTDIAGEFTMMMANHQLDPGIETVFLMAAEQYAHVSSSLLKQIAALSRRRRTSWQSLCREKSFSRYDDNSGQDTEVSVTPLKASGGESSGPS